MRVYQFRHPGPEGRRNIRMHLGSVNGRPSNSAKGSAESRRAGFILRAAGELPPKTMGRKDETIRSIALNKKARHLYHILDTIECGIALVGTEVKSLRAGRATIVDGFGVIKRGELWLHKVNIAVYSHGNINNHEPLRPRKLLVHKLELERLNKKVREKGMTLVPTQIYFHGHLVKVEMALVQGKKLHDKRHVEKERSAQRDMDRAMNKRR